MNKIVYHYLLLHLFVDIFTLEVVPLKLYPCAKLHKRSNDSCAPTIYQRKPGNSSIDYAKTGHADKSEGYTIFTLNSVMLQDGSVI